MKTRHLRTSPDYVKMVTRDLWILVPVFVALLASLAVACAPRTPTTTAPRAIVLRVDGAIVPVVADYLSRGIARGEAEGATVVIIELNTPGGLYDTTQKIVNRILISGVPVVVYVSPWAASAGTFITLAAHVSAMSPGSRIGAAHPVTMGSPGAGLSETQEEKIAQDAAAWIRSLAELRGHDPNSAEKTVTESLSFTDKEAVEEHRLVDLRANNLQDLLTRLDGRQVTLGGGRRAVLSTAPAVIEEVPMSRLESFLLAISNPNIAYILLTLAMIGIIAELYNPGTILPGTIGGVSLLLALYSLGALDAYWGGILLIVLAFALFVAELFVASSGLLTAGGIAALVIGSLILFSGSSPMFRINPWLIAVVIISVAAFFVFVIGAVLKAHQRSAVTGQEGIIGKVALVKTTMEPSGMVFVEGENWTATLEGGTAEPGEDVIVTGIEGLKLRVKKM